LSKLAPSLGDSDTVADRSVIVTGAVSMRLLAARACAMSAGRGKEGDSPNLINNHFVFGGQFRGNHFQNSRLDCCRPCRFCRLLIRFRTFEHEVGISFDMLLTAEKPNPNTRKIIQLALSVEIKDSGVKFNPVTIRYQGQSLLRVL